MVRITENASLYSSERCSQNRVDMNKVPDGMPLQWDHVQKSPRPANQPLVPLTPPTAALSAGSLLLPRSQSDRDIQKASRLLEAGRYAETIEFCNALLEKNRHNARAYAGRAEAHRRMGNLDEAIPDFQTAMGLGTFPASSVLSRALGLVFWKQGRPIEALDCFYEIVEGNFYDPLAWALIANMRALLGEEEASKECLQYARRCCEIHPNPFSGFFEPPNDLCFSACLNGDVEPIYSLCKVKLYG